MTNEIRYGRIVELDFLNAVGTIVDINEQEIDFNFFPESEIFMLGERISFIIELSASGLMAREIKKLIPSTGILLSGLWPAKRHYSLRNIFAKDLKRQLHS